MESCSRMPKSSFERQVDLDLVAREFRAAGFAVEAVYRTARAINVAVRLDFSVSGKEPMSFPAYFLIKGEYIALHFKAVPSSGHYYLSGVLSEAVRALESRGIATWMAMRKNASPRVREAA